MPGKTDNKTKTLHEVKLTTAIRILRAIRAVFG